MSYGKLIRPAYFFYNTQPSDDNDIDVSSVISNQKNPDVRGFMVDADGNVVIIDHNGQTITLYGLKAGTLYPFSPKRIKATGTTAANITLVL